MGAMVACTTPRCVSCDHATCAVCQAYKQPVNRPEKGDRLREPEEGDSLGDEDSFSVPESEGFGPEYLSGSGISPENVLLQSLTSVGPGDWEVNQSGMMSSDLHDGTEANYLDDNGGSPSSEEFTPRSESSESWQEVEDEKGVGHKVDTTLQYLSEQFLSQALDEVFKIWREGIREHHGGQRASSASKPTNPTMNGKRPESKRKRDDNSDDEHGGTGTSGPSGKKSKRQRKTTSKKDHATRNTARLPIFQKGSPTPQGLLRLWRPKDQLRQTTLEQEPHCVTVLSCVYALFHG